MALSLRYRRELPQFLFQQGGAVTREEKHRHEERGGILGSSKQPIVRVFCTELEAQGLAGELKSNTQSCCNMMNCGRSSTTKIQGSVLYYTP